MRTPRGNLDLGDLTANIAIGFGIEACQVRSPENSRQDIVEIVSNPARQKPDRFHLLRLDDLLAGLPLFRDVFTDADIVLYFAVFIGKRKNGRLRPKVTAVLLAITEHTAPFLAFAQGFADHLIFVDRRLS